MQAKNIINTINDPHVYLIINTMNSIDTSEQDLKEFNLNVKIFSEKYSLKINRVNLMKIHSNIENESSLIEFIGGCLKNKIKNGSKMQSPYKHRKGNQSSRKESKIVTEYTLEEKKSELETPGKKELTEEVENIGKEVMNKLFPSSNISLSDPSLSTSKKEAKCLIF